MSKAPRKVKKSARSHGQVGKAWVAEITPVPLKEQKPITNTNTVEIEKWLKLVEEYWDKNTRRKKG